TRLKGRRNVVNWPTGAACTMSPSLFVDQSWPPVSALTAYTRPSWEPRKMIWLAPGNASVGTAGGRAWAGPFMRNGVHSGGPWGQLPPPGALPRIIAGKTRSFETAEAAARPPE